jgi:3-deoxy-manno-octulosonate cytidylyltransferase (CMP-KDO synthetase)
MTGSVALIPARYGSTRLPGKPLLKKTGKYLIQHVYERVAAARRVEAVVVATDDERILEAVMEFGGRAMMTSADHSSGSDRIAEAASRLAEESGGSGADVVLNVQGDEPEIDPDLLDGLVELMESPAAPPIGTAAVPITDPALFDDPNTVKVVVAPGDNRALYFSRSPVPHGAVPGGALPPLKHIGVYAYRRDALLRFAGLPRSPLEETERLEQLRALDHGMEIRVVMTQDDSQGIDTPEDYEAFVKRYTLARGRDGDDR